jgi:hypothetical protein
VCVPACTTYRLVTSLLFAETYRENVALVGATGVSHQSCFCSSMACVSTVCERVCERNTSEIVRMEMELQGAAPTFGIRASCDRGWSLHHRQAASRAMEEGMLPGKLRHRRQGGDGQGAGAITARSSSSMSESLTRWVIDGNMEASHRRGVAPVEDMEASRR